MDLGQSALLRVRRLAMRLRGSGFRTYVPGDTSRMSRDIGLVCPDSSHSGEGGIRTLDGRNRPYRFSRPAHSTALPPLQAHFMGFPPPQTRSYLLGITRRITR